MVAAGGLAAAYHYGAAAIFTAGVVFDLTCPVVEAVTRHASLRPASAAVTVRFADLRV